MTVAYMIHGQYGINDVCLSLSYVVDAQGIIRSVVLPLTEEEVALLYKSANSMKDTISQLEL